MSFPSYNVSRPLLYLLTCFLLYPPVSPRDTILLMRLISCRYSYVRLNLWSNQWKDIRNKIYPSMKTREIIVLSRHQAFLRPGGSMTFSSYSITPVVKRHQRTKYFTHMWNIYIILYDIQICAGLFIRQSQRAHTCNRTSIAELRCAKMTSIVGENIQTVHILNPRSNVEKQTSTQTTKFVSLSFEINIWLS